MNKIYKVVGNLEGESKKPYHMYPIGTLVIRVDNVIVYPGSNLESYNVKEEDSAYYRQQVSITDLEETK